jgi:hypothetical protein
MPITWRNIEAPDFRQSQLGLAAAGDAFSKAFSGIENLAEDQRGIADANLESATQAFTQRAEEQLIAGTQNQDALANFDFGKFADEAQVNPIDREALHALFLTRADKLRQEELDKLQLEAQKVGIERDKIGIKQAKGDLLQQQRTKLEDTLNKGVASIVEQGQRSGLTDADITNNVRNYLQEAGNRDGQDYAWFLPKAMQTRNNMLAAADSLTGKQQSYYTKETERNKQETENRIQLETAAYQQELQKLPTLESIQAEESLDMFAAPVETINKWTDAGWFSDQEDALDTANVMFNAAQGKIRGRMERKAKDDYQKFLDKNKLTENSPEAIRYRTEKYEPALTAARAYVLPNVVKNQTLRLLPRNTEKGNQEIYFPTLGSNKIKLVEEALKQVESMESNVEKRLLLQQKHQNDIQRIIDEQAARDSAALEAAKLR